jgi:hypothetical protein
MRNISSVTIVAQQPTLPAQRILTFPLGKVTGSKGLPDVNMALPLLQLYACPAVHSALDVGLDKAKIQTLQYLIH